MHAPTATDTRSAARSSRDSLARAILAGFAAGLTMLLLFLVAFNLARVLAGSRLLAAPGLDLPRQWLINLTTNRLIDAGLSDVYLAAGIYFAGGLLWAVVYSVVESRLTGRPWVRGVTFAMLPALVSLVVVLPLLGGGLFGLALGAGPLPIIGNVLLHAVYGAMLGVVYGPFGDLDASTLERPTSPDNGVVRTSYEQTAAILLVTGALVGTFVGVLLSMLTGANAIQLPGGESTSGLILWGALIGAVFGLFIGSFLGLGRQPSSAR
jgi:hypothetical protein